MPGGFDDLLEDLLAPLGGVRLRKMFGGAGVYRDGIIFGLISDGVLYLKADEATIPAFEAEGSRPFVYDSRGKPVAMPYWRLPEQLYDEPDAFHAWAEAAWAVAARTAKPKKRKAPERP